MTERTLPPLSPEATQAPPFVDGPVRDDSARNRLVISLLLVSAFVVILNETIMAWRCRTS